LPTCAERRRAGRGFTLIETLVVMAICVGLIAMMTALFRSVGTSAQALRGGQQEWLMQRQVREQLLHLFSMPKATLAPLSGKPNEMYFSSWRSRAQALNGMPAIGYFRYDAATRTLWYHELPLPAWWSGQASEWNASRLQEDVRLAHGFKVLTAVDDLRFRFLADGGEDPLQDRAWVQEWLADKAPRLVQMNFTKAGRSYSIWFSTLALDA
jgi:prepilin-type N-terminal cleavage/methylation domain-containing protein